MAELGSVGSTQIFVPCPSTNGWLIPSSPSPVSSGLIPLNPEFASAGWIRAKISCTAILGVLDISPASPKSLKVVPLPSGLFRGLSSMLSFENIAFMFLTSSLVWLVVFGEVLSCTKSRMDLMIGSKPSSFGSHHFCSSASDVPQTSAILVRKVGGYI